jgi:hypothetical protein
VAGWSASTSVWHVRRVSPRVSSRITSAPTSSSRTGHGGSYSPKHAPCWLAVTWTGSSRRGTPKYDFLLAHFFFCIPNSILNIPFSTDQRSHLSASSRESSTCRARAPAQGSREQDRSAPGGPESGETKRGQLARCQR